MSYSGSLQDSSELNENEDPLLELFELPEDDYSIFLSMIFSKVTLLNLLFLTFCLGIELESI